jgi:hypothetical protein
MKEGISKGIVVPKVVIKKMIQEQASVDMDKPDVCPYI